MRTFVSVLRVGALALCVAVLAGCGRKAGDRVQGYVEGEYVYVASPFAGQLETLSVQRGMQVKPGAPLFALECGLETAAREEAQRRLVQGAADNPRGREERPGARRKSNPPNRSSSSGRAPRWFFRRKGIQASGRSLTIAA